MNDVTLDAGEARLARDAAQKAALGRGLRLVLLAGVLALGLRTLVYEPFNIPSESMLPGVQPGDYVFVAKWPYGYGRHSLPLGLLPLDGRIAGALPRRGDVIVFKTPRDQRTDYIKRVIGLPGDTVAMRGGRVVLNGRELPQQRIADVVVPQVEDCAAGPGRPDFRVPDRAECRFPAWREQLPDGLVHPVIDQLQGDVSDDVPAVRVPPGHVWVLGDNRDDSADSRFPIRAGGVGLVPLDNVIGRADRIFLSVDPRARLADPGSWSHVLRLERIGRRP